LSALPITDGGGAAGKWPKKMKTGSVLELSLQMLQKHGQRSDEFGGRFVLAVNGRGSAT
jgi:hypothetical protein